MQPVKIVALYTFYLVSKKLLPTNEIQKSNFIDFLRTDNEILKNIRRK